MAWITFKLSLKKIELFYKIFSPPFSFIGKAKSSQHRWKVSDFWLVTHVHSECAWKSWLHSKGLGVAACCVELRGCGVCQYVSVRSKPRVSRVAAALLKDVCCGGLVGPSAGHCRSQSYACRSQERLSGGHLNWLGPGIFAGPCHITGSLGQALEEYSQVGLCISLTPVLSASSFSVALC